MVSSKRIFASVSSLMTLLVLCWLVSFHRFISTAPPIYTESIITAQNGATAIVNVIDNKTRILITGYGHSATTYMQQFIGEVLLNKQSVFYLFEAAHILRLEELYLHYNKVRDVPVDIDHRKEIPKFISYFFRCDFHFQKQKREYYRMILHINKPLKNGNISHQLTKKCLSSQYLIYKEIHFHDYIYGLPILWKAYPKLKVIAMTRNPVTHIPSLLRLTHALCHVDIDADCQTNVPHAIALICKDQLKQLQYGMRANNMMQFHLVKLEEFFVNLSTHKFNNTVKYFGESLFNFKWNEINILEELKRRYHAIMRQNLWPHNQRSAPEKELLTHFATYQQNVTDECAQFGIVFDYDLTINAPLN
eukprot:11535_1